MFKWFQLGNYYRCIRRNMGKCMRVCRWMRNLNIGLDMKINIGDKIVYDEQRVN